MSFLDKFAGLFGMRLIKNSEYDKLLYSSRANYSSMTKMQDTVGLYEAVGSLVENSHPTIFDVGAYVGSETKRYKDLFPEALIHAFEPFKTSYAELLKNTEQFQGVTAVNAAVSDSTGSAVLNVGEFAPTNFLLHGDEKSCEFWGEGIVDLKEEQRVKTFAIDDYCSGQKIDRIDILKLDVQGMELPALKGAESMLNLGKIDLIITEAIFVPTYKGQTPFDQLFGFLTDRGYICYNMFNLKSAGGRLNQADIVFIKDSK